MTSPCAQQMPGNVLSFFSIPFVVVSTDFN
jgi:hypothetical protein